jgi:hypothetical protein
MVAVADDWGSMIPNEEYYRSILDYWYREVWGQQCAVMFERVDAAYCKSWPPAWLGWK